jgi:quercetin 2,3-dioxygenase
MSNLRSIEQIMAPPAPHWVGDAFRVHNFFPGNLDLKRMSPFFLLDYGAKIEFPPSDTPRGVGVHPHRGFETVTIAYHGKVAHHDSAGHRGVIGEGDVQWMTAASGILHKEYHEEAWSKKGGMAQMAQIWVNLPAKDKMSNPKYQSLKQDDFKRFTSPGQQSEVEVIAGNYNGTLGIAKTFTPIEMYNAYVKSGEEVLFSFPKHYNTAFLVIEGSVTVNESAVPADYFVLFANDGTDIRLTATENAIVLVLSGEPIHEPIVSYGPFVMNTKQEILQAYDDLNAGKFGYLE